MIIHIMKTPCCSCFSIYADSLSEEVVQTLVDLLWEQLANIVQSLCPALVPGGRARGDGGDAEGEETEVSSLSTSQIDIHESTEESGKEDEVRGFRHLFPI